MEKNLGQGLGIGLDKRDTRGNTHHSRQNNQELSQRIKYESMAQNGFPENDPASLQTYSRSEKAVNDADVLVAAQHQHIVILVNHRVTVRNNQVPVAKHS